MHQPENESLASPDVLERIPWESLDVPANVSAWAAVAGAVLCALIAALRPFVRWAEEQYARQSEHLRELEKGRIEAERRRIEEMTRLIAAVERLTGVVTTLTELKDGS